MGVSRNAPGRVTMLLGLCGFWLGLGIACWRFPGEYYWHYMTVSNLFSAKHNPPGYLWGVAGIVLCGALGTCAVALGLGASSATGERRSLRHAPLLALGFPCMTLAAALRSEWLIPKGHDWLAVIAFLTLCSGLVRAWVQSILSRFPAPPPQRRARAIALMCVVLWPVAGAALTQAYLALARPELPWVTLAWREQHIPLYLSFALWEWLTCLVLSGCLAMLCLLPPARAQPRISAVTH
jgi:hypothetical protein